MARRGSDTPGDGWAANQRRLSPACPPADSTLARTDQLPASVRYRVHILAALYEEGVGVKGGGRGLTSGPEAEVVLISLSPPRWEDQVGWESHGWPISVEGRHAARAATWGLAGAGLNGAWVVSMRQMASASLRATSTRATAGPRWPPSRRLVAW